MKYVNSVLIVDDNQGDIEIAGYFLRKSERYKHVFSVSDGAEALELYQNYETSRAHRPDEFPPLLVLLDINMPRLSGFEFLDEFAKLDLPNDDPAIIVMLTSSQFEDDIRRADEHEKCSGYLVKPLSLSAATNLADLYGEEAGSPA